jgi:23S rRNA (uracil1939-C5)-methyltransferase
VHADGKRVGFYPKFGRDLVDIAACPIACDAVNAALDNLRRTYPTPGEYPLSARSDVRFFEQTNDGAAAELLRVVDEAVGDNNTALVDAYSGAGFFGRRLAPRFDEVIGIETHEGAVAAARKRAGPKERYLCGDVANQLGGVLEALPRDRTVVLLDPPASGVAARVTDLLTALPVARVVYVSCDPATLARDLGALSRGGYRVSTVTPLDMFPQTADVEVVAVLEQLAPHRPQDR